MAAGQPVPRARPRTGGACAGRRGCAGGGRSPGSGRRALRCSSTMRPASAARIGRRTIRSSRAAHPSTVPTKRLPTPSRPAATAPCSDSGALPYTRRAASTLGVSPCSISATRQASTTAVCAGVGQAAQDLEARHLGERQLADELAAQALAAHDDVVGGGGGDGGPGAGTGAGWSGSSAFARCLLELVALDLAGGAARERRRRR